MKKNYYQRKIINAIFYVMSFSTYAQIGINTPSPHPNAQVEVFSDSKGFQVPRLTSLQRNEMDPALTETANGLIIFNTSSKCLEYYNGTQWVNLCGGTTPITEPIVTRLDCTGSTTGTFTINQPGTGTKVINYEGGNGEPYPAIVIQSTGVIGLNASTPGGTLANGNGSIQLTISGIPTSSGMANFILNLGGQTCTFSVNIQASLRAIKVLSIIPDSWNTNLSDGLYTTVARSKLNNSSNFGASGTVKTTGFSYSTINVYYANESQIEAAIDDADIIWIGYIANSYLPANSVKRQVIQQKIAEKKKFFFIGNDNYGGGFFPGITTFAGNTFGYYGFGTYQISALDANGPNKGIFGNLSPGAKIQQTRAIGKVTQYPGTPFLSNPDGTVNAVSGDNYVIVGDINWHANYESTDGFYLGTSSCTENNSSILFCNIFEKAINYVLSQ